MKLSARWSPLVLIAYPQTFLALFPAPAKAQNTAFPPYAGVVESTISSTGNETNSSGVNRTWSLQQQVKLDVRLEKHPTLPMLAGKATGAVSINFSYTETLTSGCKNVRTVKYSGPYVAPTVWYNEGRPYMTLVSVMNYYELYMPKDFEADLVMSTRCSTGTPDLVSRRVQLEWGVTPLKGNLSSDGAAEGHRDGTLSGFPNSVFSNIPAPKFSLDYRLTSKQEPDEIELVVDRQEYDTWLPRGGADEKTAGNTLNVKATLQMKQGGTLTEKARSIRFELVDSSHQPGVDINFPPSAQATRDADLKFDRKLNPAMRQDTATETRVETPEGEYVTASAVVSCYDWGAYGRIRVTAVLTSGREVVGYLKGESGYTLIRIPKRAEGSFIADKWKEDKGVSGRPDNDDSEDDPIGDKAETGHQGDGLTLYEEYRGYHENGVHKDDLDPLGKDFFIRNRSGWFVRGIQIFAAATRLNVHHQLLDSELEDRVINFNNQRDSLHLVDQHGVIVIVNPTRKGSACAVPMQGTCETGHPSTPKHFKQLEMPTSGKRLSFLFGGVKTSYLDLTLAHELLHACNVYHHGDNDLGPVKLVAEYVDGELKVREYTDEGAATVRLLRENGEEIPAVKFIKETHPYVGREGGQHSGWEACLMRYDAASFYIREGAPKTRFYGGNERMGAQLCSTPDGTGVNDPNQPFPRPRFGNASRGRCRFQLCINDRYEHPER